MSEKNIYMYRRSGVKNGPALPGGGGGASEETLFSEFKKF